MILTEEDKDYISKIYRHGLNHLVNDTIPNRLICVHNIHWCLETLLRKATVDWQSPKIDIKDNFEKILHKFSRKRNPSPKLQKAVSKLNTIRNNMQHKDIYVDILSIKKILPEVYDFVKWLVKTEFKSEIDIFSIPPVDINIILKHFEKWREIWTQTYYSSRKKEDKRLADYFFGCIIPSCYSNDLVDLSFEGIEDMIHTQTKMGVTISFNNPEHESKIEKYFRQYNHIFGRGMQVITIPDYMQGKNDIIDIIHIFPDGLIFFGYKFRYFSYEDYSFNLDQLIKTEGTRYIMENAQKKYHTPLREYIPKNLEHVLKLICFPFHPDCTEELVKLKTKYFTGCFILTDMTRFRKYRKLERNEWPPFLENREYASENPEINFIKAFSYEEIPEILEEFERYCYKFFRNKEDTAFL